MSYPLDPYRPSPDSADQPVPPVDPAAAAEPSSDPSDSGGSEAATEVIASPEVSGAAAADGPATPPPGDAEAAPAAPPSPGPPPPVDQSAHHPVTQPTAVYPVSAAGYPVPPSVYPAPPAGHPDGSPPAVESAPPEPRITPASAFAAVRARWLILFAVAGLVVVVLLEALIALVLNLDPFSSELFASLFYLPLVVWALFVQWRNKVDLRLLFRRPRIGRYWWIVLGMIVVLLVFSLGASNVTAALLPDYVASAEISTDPGPLALILTVAVVPPFVEELIFRGLLLERWAVRWRIGTAVIVQAVLFGVLHVDPVGAGVFGVVLALIYLRTATLWVPIVMHAANNGLVLVAVFLFGDAAQDAAVPADAGEAAVQVLVGLLIMGIAAPFIVVFIKRQWPGPDRLTPYEEGDLGAAALPPRRLGKADVAGRRLFAAVLPDGLLLSTDRAGKLAQWAVPFREVTYQAVTPDWRHMLLMGPGGQLQLDFPQTGQRARTRAMHAIAERVRVESGVAAEWWR